MDVLLVDDAAQIRSRLAALCADVPGVRNVLQADDSSHAKALLFRHRPGVVVLDLHLKQDSGLTLLKYIKREQADTLVIILTNHASQHHRHSCSALGADHFFDKSIEFESLLPVLAAHALRNRS